MTQAPDERRPDDVPEDDEAPARAEDGAQVTRPDTEAPAAEESDLEAPQEATDDAETDERPEDDR